MEKLKSNISKFSLTLILLYSIVGFNNRMKAQFTGSTFIITNTNPCSVDVFFEFKTPCAGFFSAFCFMVTVSGGGGSVPVSVVAGGDALMRVYPNGYVCGVGGGSFLGDFSANAVSGGCFSPSVPAGTPVSGNDCNGAPNALNVVVNPIPTCNCMVIY